MHRDAQTQYLNELPGYFVVFDVLIESEIVHLILKRE